MTKENNKFPVLGFSKYEGCPAYVKWNDLDNSWALQVHSQTLERLAERGGLSPEEIVYNLNKLQWGTKVGRQFAICKVKEIAFNE